MLVRFHICVGYSKDIAYEVKSTYVFATRKKSVIHFHNKTIIQNYLSDGSAVKVLMFLSYKRQSKVCNFTDPAFANKYISGGKIAVKYLLNK